MREIAAAESQPSRVRKIGATIATVFVVVVAWKVIDHRMQPPPPPVHSGTVHAPGR